MPVTAGIGRERASDSWGALREAHAAIVFRTSCELGYDAKKESRKLVHAPDLKACWVQGYKSVCLI